MAGRLCHVASRITGGNGIASRSVELSLRQRSGMGLPFGKYISPDKPVERGWRASVNARKGYSFRVEKFLKRIGLGKEDHYFWKQIFKALFCTYTIGGLAWLYNETSPLGWWSIKIRPKEEKEMAHLYVHRKFPYPGDQEAMDEFIAKGGMIGTAIGPKGFVEGDQDFVNFEKDLQDKKFEQEAMKLWLRMRNEVISELQEKGFDIE